MAQELSITITLPLFRHDHNNGVQREKELNKKQHYYIDKRENAFSSE